MNDQAMPLPIGLDVGAVVGDLHVQEPMPPDLVEYRLEAVDLELGVPPAYLGAELLPRVRDILRGAWDPNTGTGSSSVTLIGPPGTGKTRQAWAAFRANRRRRLGHLLGSVAAWDRNVEQVPERDSWVRSIVRHVDDQVRIISESGDILRHRWDRKWLDHIASYPYWMVIDDIGFAQSGDWSIEAIYHIANERLSWQLPTLWTTNLTPAQLRQVYSPAIASRLLGGNVINLNGKDRRIDG
jgi:hypothetical protein